MSVIVLMYHHVSPENIPLSVTPVMFETQMRWLRAQNYTFLRQSDFEALSTKGVSTSGRSVMVTFDDGCADVFEHAFPILRELAIPSTHFVITKNLEQKYNDGHFGWTHAETMLASGQVELGSHSHFHRRYDRETNDRAKVLGQVELDLVLSRETLTRHVGHVSKQLSWPWGYCPREYRNIATHVGFSWQYQAFHGRADLVNDALQIPRIRIDSSLAAVFRPLLQFWSSRAGLLLTPLLATRNARLQRLEAVGTVN